MPALPGPKTQKHPGISKMFGSSSNTAVATDVESGGGGDSATSGSIFSSWRGSTSSTAASSTSYVQVPTWLGGSGEEEEEDPCACLKLSYYQRVVGFVACFSLGAIISFMSIPLLLNPAKFALPYTLGNILSLLATGFLVGPKRMCRQMCAPVRYIAVCC